MGFGTRIQLCTMVTWKIVKTAKIYRFNSSSDSMIFMIKRAVSVPGFSYTLGQTSSDDEQSQKNFSILSFYTKFRVIAEIFIFENLSKFFIVGWILNFLRLCIGLFEIYPFMAVLRLGKKYAFVDINPSKKTN